MPASAYLQQAMVNAIQRGTSYTAPSTVYAALHTGDPGSGGANEVSGGGYTRSAITANTSQFNTATAGGTTTSKNVNAITFPTATGSWGTVTYASLWDTSSGGNMLYYAALTTSKTVTTDDIVSFDALLFTVAIT